MRKSSSTDLIEELHEDKGVEDEGVVLRGPLDGVSIGHPKQVVTIEYQPVHHRKLEYALAYNVLDHLTSSS